MSVTLVQISCLSLNYYVIVEQVTFLEVILSLAFCLKYLFHVSQTYG